MEPKDYEELADKREEALMDTLAVPFKSPIYTSGDDDPAKGVGGLVRSDLLPGQHYLLGPDPRLTVMPEKPTIVDFYRQRTRVGGVQHMLQSARLALKNGFGEKVAVACLLHDIAVNAFIRGDHGYWGAQLITPYVDEEISWAIRAHQALRFFPDPANGYEYPEVYVEWFGKEYRPEPYIYKAYEEAKKSKYYLTARLICVNDLYAFDAGLGELQLDEFEDLLLRYFRQPEEGLGFDGSPVAHMWRTIMWPTRFL